MIEILDPLVPDFETTRDWRTPWAIALLGHAYNTAGRHREAIAILTHALQRLPATTPIELSTKLYAQRGVAYSGTQDFEAARRDFEQVLALWGGRNQQAVGGMAINLGDVLVKQGDHARAIARFREADQVAEAEADATLRQEARVRWVLALEALGRHGEADAVAAANPASLDATRFNRVVSEALADRAPARSLQWSSRIDLRVLSVDERVAILETRGVCFLDIGDPASARDVFQAIVDLGTQSGSRRVQTRGLRHLGSALTGLGDAQTAILVFDRALATDDGSDPQILLNILINMAEPLRIAGAYAKAAGSLTRTKQVVSTLDPTTRDTRMALAALETQLGNVHDPNHDPIAAEAAYRRALAALQGIDTQAADDARRIVTLNLTTALMVQGRQVPGKYVEAIAVLRDQLRGAETPFARAALLVNLGHALRVTGQFAEARERATEARTLGEQVSHAAVQVSALNALGLLATQVGDLSGALEHFEAAIALSAKAIDPLVSSQSFANAAFVARALQQRDKALDYYEQAVGAADRARSGSGGAAARESLHASGLDVYRAAIEVALGSQDYRRAWLLIERSRSRELLDRLSAAAPGLDEKASPIVRDERIAWGRVQVARSRLSEASLDAAAYGKARDHYAAAIADHDRALERMTAECPLCLQGASPEPLALNDLQARLGETRLISYVVVDDRIVAFKVGRASLEVHELPVSRGRIVQLVDTLLRFDSVQIVPSDVLQALHDGLWSPLAAGLDGASVVVVPHGILHRVPFAALWDGRRYLIDRVTVTIVPSASVLAHVKPQTAGPEEPLVVGRVGGLRGVLLHHAVREAREIASLYGVSPLIDRAASESHVRERMAGASMLHLSTHAELRPDSPFESALALEPDQQHDGRLTVAEIVGLRMDRGPLVVLSACDTQHGRLGAGDELVALQRGFLAAGASAIAATLGPVDEESTRALMKRFHEDLRRGLSVAGALREAQKDLRSQAQWEHPFYWAGFVATSGLGVK